MARIRTLKPEILEDAVTAGLSNAGFRLYVAGILLADDFGNLRADVELLRALVFRTRTLETGIAFLLGKLSSLVERAATLIEPAFPTLSSEFREMALEARSYKDDDVEAARNEIEASGLWFPYTVRGQHYASIRNWKKHQKVDHPGRPRVPPPDEADGPSGRYSGPPLSGNLHSGTPPVKQIVHSDEDDGPTNSDSGPTNSPQSSRKSRERLASDSRGSAKPAKSPGNGGTRESLAKSSRGPRESLGFDLRSPISDHRSPIREGILRAHTRTRETWGDAPPPEEGSNGETRDRERSSRADGASASRPRSDDSRDPSAPVLEQVAARSLPED